MATRVVSLAYWQAVEYSYYEIQRGTQGDMAEAVAALEAHPECQALHEALAREMEPENASIGNESVVNLCTRHILGEPPICPTYAYAGCGGTASGLIAAFAMPMPMDGKPCMRVALSGRWDVAYSFDTLSRPNPAAAAIASNVRKGVIRYCPRSHEFFANPDWAVDDTPRCVQAPALKELCDDATRAGLPLEGTSGGDGTPFENLLTFGRSMLSTCKAMQERLAMCQRASRSQADTLNAINDGLRRMLSEVDVNYPREGPGRQATHTLGAQSLHTPALCADVQSRLIAVVQAVEGWRSHGAALTQAKAALAAEAEELTHKHATLTKAFGNLSHSHATLTSQLHQGAVERELFYSLWGSGFPKGHGPLATTRGAQTTPRAGTADASCGPTDDVLARKGGRPNPTDPTFQSESAMASVASSASADSLEAMRANPIETRPPGAYAREVGGTRLPHRRPGTSGGRKDPFHTPMGGMVGWLLLGLWYAWNFGLASPFQAPKAEPGIQAPASPGRLASGAAVSAGAYQEVAEGGRHFSGMPTSPRTTIPPLVPPMGHMLGNHSLWA